jgi:hypothetical protein
MSKLRCHISISAYGFVAGPNQSEENPLGEGGERLHDWAVSLAAWRESHDKRGGEVNESTPIMEETFENVGAGVLGRNMFGPVGGGAPGRTRAPYRSVLLGDGARLFDNLEGAGIEVEQVRAVEAPGVTHLKYRVMT